MDLSAERLLTCALCGRQEWVKEASRTSRWMKSHSTARFMDIGYCPEHEQEGLELEKTLTEAFKQDAEGIVAGVRERITAQRLEQGPEERAEP